MGKIKVIYWKGLKKDDVKVRSFDTDEESDEFLKNNSDQYKEYLVCRKKGETGSDGVEHYRIANKGAYILFQVVAYAISFTVMVVVIAGILYLRYRLISKN